MQWKDNKSTMLLDDNSKFSSSKLRKMQIWGVSSSKIELKSRREELSVA